MAKVQIVADHGFSQSAWTKAPEDVARIAERMGFVRMRAGKYRLGNFSLVRRVFRRMRLEHWVDRICWKFELASLLRRFGDGGGELLLQYPLPTAWIFDLRNIEEIRGLKQHGIKVVLVVHDVGFLRGESADVGGKTNMIDELRVFGLADRLIVHNGNMLEYLGAHNIAHEKMISLDVFDYLLFENFIPRKVAFDRSVIVAGALGAGKSAFVGKLKEIKGVLWRLYGPNYEEKRCRGENVQYRGCFQPTEVPLHLSGSFGLVWDGDSIETCAGATGEYLRYNNPHKFSLYLACGIPVIVWKHAAIAVIVERYGLGFCIGSLLEIHDVIENMTAVQYEKLREGAMRFGKRLRNGEFMSAALDKAML